jgi:hypothetical protein
MGSAISHEEPVAEIVEAPPKRQRVVRKKVELVSLEGEEEAAPAPKKTRKKLTEEESEPASVSFKSAKGDVSFSARKRAKPEAAPPPEPEPAPAPLVRVPPAKAPALRPVRAGPQPTRVKAPPTPGLYDMLHEHLSARGAERSQRWGQFLIA